MTSFQYLLLLRREVLASDHTRNLEQHHAEVLSRLTTVLANADVRFVVIWAT